MARRSEHPPEATLNWTRRQRQVLDLLARGKTNAEIADALGVSLAGAKWHVSEVISKLGVESREQAAAYWREQNTIGARFGRSLQGLAGLLSLKTVGGGIAAATVGAVAVGAVLVAADSGSEEPTVAIDATPTHAPPAPAATPTPQGFVAQVPAPDWWIPPQDRPLPEDLESTPPCQTGWDEAVGFAYLKVPRNEYYFVMTRETFTTGGSTEIACASSSGRIEYAWDSSGNLVEKESNGSVGGGGFVVDSEAPTGCGLTGPSGTIVGEDGPISLPIQCSVPLNVAYAIVDDGSSERVDALPLPTILGFPRKAIVAGHSTTTGFVIEFFEADGTLVDRKEFSMPGDVAPPAATPGGPGPGPGPTSAPDDPTLFRPADAPSSSPSTFVPAVEPPAWLSPSAIAVPPPVSLCGEDWENATGVASFTSAGQEYFVQLLPDTERSPASTGRFCQRHFTTEGLGGAGSLDLTPGTPHRCNYSSGGPDPHYLYCMVPANVSYAIVDDGTPEGIAATELPTILGIERRGIFGTHTSPDGSMTAHFYDENDTLLETFYRPPNP